MEELIAAVASAKNNLETAEGAVRLRHSERISVLLQDRAVLDLEISEAMANLETEVSVAIAEARIRMHDAELALRIAQKSDPTLV